MKEANNLKDIKTQKEIKERFNTTEKINFFYSTPEKYFNSIKDN